MLNLTPQCFAEVIVLSVYWEHWPPKLVHNVSVRGNPYSYHSVGFTTVDHVLKMLRRLEAVSDNHIRMVQHKRNGIDHQRKLLRHCGVSYGSTYVTNNDSWLLCNAGA